ncbi:MAG: hypothetical protein GF405_03210 [Candidatus Eisenbacteria bacterium]|nr:hypothetical protein [Candidatus Eisenbacteria bacterium]
MRKAGRGGRVSRWSHHAPISLILCLPVSLSIMLAGCGDTAEPAWDNLPPETTILEPDEPSGTVTVANGDTIWLRWSSVDPEERIGLSGGIAVVRLGLNYEQVVELDCPSYEGEWWFSSTAESGSVHYIESRNMPTGGNVIHEFTVLAQDVEGLWESEAASYAFRYNHPPTSEILRPAHGETVGTSFTVAWQGADVDGEVAGYQYALLPDEAYWHTTTDTSVAFTVSGVGEREFRLQAWDDTGCLDSYCRSVSFFVE